MHRIYETTFIVNPQTDNASIEQSVRAVADLITNNGGRIVKQDHMGMRRLAYEIQGLTQGYYATFIFESEAKVLPVLERHFKLEDPYIRHLLIRFDGDPRWLEDTPEESMERPAPAPMQSPAGTGRRPESHAVSEGRRESAKPEARPVAEPATRESEVRAESAPTPVSSPEPAAPVEERREKLTDGDEL